MLSSHILFIVKRFNELYPKKDSKKESKKKEKSSTVTVQVQSPKKKKSVENVDGDEEMNDEDDVPKPERFKDPYADLPKR